MTRPIAEKPRSIHLKIHTHHPMKDSTTSVLSKCNLNFQRGFAHYIFPADGSGFYVSLLECSSQECFTKPTSLRVILYMWALQPWRTAGRITRLILPTVESYFTTHAGDESTSVLGPRAASCDAAHKPGRRRDNLSSITGELRNVHISPSTFRAPTAGQRCTYSLSQTQLAYGGSRA